MRDVRWDALLALIRRMLTTIVLGLGMSGLLITLLILSGVLVVCLGLMLSVRVLPLSLILIR